MVFVNVLGSTCRDGWAWLMESRTGAFAPGPPPLSKAGRVTSEEPEPRIEPLALRSLGLGATPGLGGFQTSSWFDKVSEIWISHCWPIRPEWAPSHLLGPVAWLGS